MQTDEERSDKQRQHKHHSYNVDWGLSSLKHYADCRDDSGQQEVGTNAICSAGWLWVLGEGRFFAEELAVSGSIAVGIAGEIDIAHAVWPHQI